jgi:hypothetical protein
LQLGRISRKERPVVVTWDTKAENERNARKTLTTSELLKEEEKNNNPSTELVKEKRTNC